MDRTIMPLADSKNKELTKLLVLLEADEEERSHGPDAALKRLALLHQEQETKALAAHTDQQVLSEKAVDVRNFNPIGARVFLALVKGRDQGS
jgi:hypothetical protein